jgi:hypothetical protein
MTSKRSLPSAILALLLLLSVAPPAYAQENLQVEFSLIKTSNAPQRHLLDTAEWNKQIVSGRHQVLDRGGVSGRMEQEMYTNMGRKVPFAFEDPRAASYQVQYVDAAFKIDCKARPEGDRIRVEVRAEQSRMAGNGQGLEPSDSFVVESICLLKRGQTAIIGSSQGALTSRFLGKIAPGLGADETILFAVSIK